MHPQDRLFCEIAVQLNLLTREQVTRCLQAQQREASKNIAQLAVSLGLMNQVAVENVMQQQSRLLERRREARNASLVQREAESRLAGSQPIKPGEPSRPMSGGSGGQHPAARPVRRDPTPTSRWVSEVPAQNRLRHTDSIPSAAEFLGSPELDAAATRETLDVRPPGRSSAARAPSFEVPARAQPLAARTPDLTPPPSNRPWALGSEIEQRSPPFTAAATSVPVPAPSGPPALSGTRSSSALEPPIARRVTEPLAAALTRGPASRPLTEPTPAPRESSGREWRNPSRPPPPSVGFDIEIGPVTPLPRAPSGALGLGQFELASVFQASAPGYDEPRYIERALELCELAGASDLMLHAGAVPYVRVDGSLRVWSPQPPLAAEQLDQMLLEILDESQLLALSVDGEHRCIYELPSGLRVRTHAFASDHGPNLVLRLLPRAVLSPEQLGLGSVLEQLRAAPHGLWICSGPAGSGKSSTLCSLIQALAAERALHIVSLEQPIEHAFSGGLGLYDQRELGKHVASYAEGIDWAVAQAADVIVVADLLAPRALAASLRACRAGRLVLAGLRASSSQKALSSLLCASEPESELLRLELSHALKLLLHQRLVPLAKGPGRVAAFEQLVQSAPLCQLIREDQLSQLPTVLAAGRSVGMVSLDDALDALVAADSITLAAACAAVRSGARFHSP